MQLKIELKRGVDNTPVEAYLVDLGQRHVDDYVNIIPDRVIKLAENQIFVFGSNTQGRHGAGSALFARHATVLQCRIR